MTAPHSLPRCPMCWRPSLYGMVGCNAHVRTIRNAKGARAANESRELRRAEQRTAARLARERMALYAERAATKPPAEVSRVEAALAHLEACCERVSLALRIAEATEVEQRWWARHTRGVA